MYDPNTTIASIASIIYKQVSNDNPLILTKLSITCDIDQIDDDDIETNCDDSNTENDHLSSAASSSTTTTTTTTQSLARVILHNRALVDGYRGIAISLVLIEHLTRHNSFIIYLHVDMMIFIMITGFMLALQELLTIETSSLSSNNNTSKIENTPKFLPLAWLKSRAIGLFPLYWIALLLNIPRFYTNVVGSEELNLNQIQLFWYIVVHIFALQDWSLKWSNNINIYYISLIWNVFIIYACYKSIYFSKYNYLFKFIGFTTITLFLILLDIYYNHIEIGLKAILSPQWGFVFFTVGFLAALLFSWIYKSEYWKLFLLKSTVKTQEEYDSLLLTKQNGDDDYVHNQQLRKVSILSSLPSSLRDYDNNRYLQYRNIPSYATDFLAAIFVILVFTSLGGDNKNVTTAMVYFVLPLLFLALLITSFLQPINNTTTTSSSLPLLQASSSSFFTRLAKTRLFVTMGQSSLAIYMFHNILIFYYYDNVIIAGQNHYHHSPYTRKFVSKYNHDGKNLQFKNGAYDFIAFLIVIPFGIFMQKIIQDRLIPKLINHVEVLYQKQIYYGSSREIITEQNNVVLEKKIDVDKDI